MTGMSERTLYNWEKAGRFPKRFKVGTRAVAWSESAVAAFLTARAQGKEYAA